jgi:hypothetical protein
MTNTRYPARRVVATIAVALLATGVVACSDDDGTSVASTLPGDPTSTPTSGTTDSSIPDGTDDTGAGTTVAGTASDTTDGDASGTTAAPTATEVEVTVDPSATVPFVPGNGDTVPVQTVATLPPVAIDEPADTTTGMTFRLERLEAVQGEATGPGEIAGPAVRVTVVATNGTTSPVLLDGTVVDLIYGPDHTSAAPLSGPGAERFAASIDPGASATAVYVFDVPVDQRAEVSVIVSYLASVSPVVFTGPAPAA